MSEFSDVNVSSLSGFTTGIDGNFQSAAQQTIGAAASATNFATTVPPVPVTLDAISQMTSQTLAANTVTASKALSSIGQQLSANAALGAMSSSDSRLNVIQPRSAVNVPSYGSYTSLRGPIASMKLLTNPSGGYNPVAQAKSLAGASTVDVSNDVNALMSSTEFVNFFITQVSVTYSEKTQIMTTFGDNEVVYYFGTQPIIFSISGLLFDSMQNDWFSHFIQLYQSVLRGSQLATNFALIQLTLPNMVLTGTISQLATNQDSQRDTDIAFSMQFVAKSVVPLPVIQVGAPNTNMLSTLIDFSANQSGIQGYSNAIGTVAGGFTNPVISTIGNVTGTVAGIGGSSAFPDTALTSFRTNIFSPILGVISSITQVVQTNTGTVSAIVNSLSNEVAQVVRDITSFASEATSIANMVENSLNYSLPMSGTQIADVGAVLSSLNNSAGVITRVPATLGDNVRSLLSSGQINANSPTLTSRSSTSISLSAILSSGAAYNPSTSNILS